MQLREILQRVPDPRGRQGRDYFLWSLLALVILSLLSGRRGMMAAFRLGRSLSLRELAQLGFPRGTSPCHATLTETLRAIDAQALGDILGSLSASDQDGARHISIDGKTMRASKDKDGKSEHVLSAFCGELETILGHCSSKGKGLEIPDALRLLERLDLKDKIITGDALFCQRRIAEKITGGGGDYIFPVKNNQKFLREEIETAFKEPVFPLCLWDSGLGAAHGRIEQRIIEVLPAAAIGEETRQEWPSISQVCRVRRLRQTKKRGIWQEPTCQEVFLITSLSSATTPQEILRLNRNHWAIEIMHRNKDVTLGEDGYTNRSNNAPGNIFSLIGFALKLLKSVSSSPTRAIEIFQDDRKRAIAMF